MGPNRPISGRLNNPTSWVILFVLVGTDAGPRMEQQMSALTEEQRTALITYAEQKGRFWKRALLEDWMRAAPRISGELQQIRNTLGPTWLRGVSLKEVTR